MELFRSEADGFAQALGGANLDSVVPTCPDWTVRDLARHVGSLHRWAASIVERGIAVETWRPPEPLEYPDEADGPEAWAAWIARRRRRGQGFPGLGPRCAGVGVGR